MSNKPRRRSGALFFIALLCTLMTGAAWAQHAAPQHGAGQRGDAVKGSAATEVTEATEKLTGKEVGAHGGGHKVEGHGATAHGATTHGATGGAHETKAPGTFDPHGGTLLNPLARMIFGLGPVEKHHGHFTNIQYDYIVIALTIMLVLAILGTIAAKKAKLRPEGKPTSLPNLVEAAADGFRNYLISVMGQDLGTRYAPLVASFFFTILFFNWMGLVPGMLAPTANPNIPIALALCAFFAVHIIAIKEAGVKSWFMHFVGEPVWLAPLNFPLHLIGELIKPMSLSIRLLCNVFGEEMVALQLSLLAVAAMATLQIPLPFQLPMMLLGTFFGLLQALVFSTLLAIYISILATHHGDHDEHNVHGHTEHVHAHGFNEVVAHPSQSPVA